MDSPLMAVIAHLKAENAALAWARTHPDCAFSFDELVGIWLAHGAAGFADLLTKVPVSL
jgi:hypothetical protein